MTTILPRSLYSKVLAFVSASTLASCLVLSWIAIESQHADLRTRLAEQYPRELAQQETLLRSELTAANWSLDDALSGVAGIAGEPEAPAPLVLRRALASASSRGLLGLALVDGEGDILAGRLVHQPLPTQLTKVLRAGAVLTEIDARGQTILAVARKIEGRSVYLVGSVSRTEAHASLRQLSLRILTVDACLVLLFTLIAQRITKQILAPVHTLSAAARRVSSGDLDVEIDIARKPIGDELGVLARAFEHMLRRLRTNQREIEDSNAVLVERNEELRRANEVLSQLSITDGLTKLHNHRYFQDLLMQEARRSDRTGAPLSLMLVDIDDFKKLNDRYGHAAGDQVLRRLAEVLHECVRETDMPARYGGEEFVVLSSDTDLDGAIVLAEKIRLAIEQTRFQIEDHATPLEISVSVGVAQYSGNPKRLFRAADAALYRAKAEGKNCVACAEPGDATG